MSTEKPKFPPNRARIIFDGATSAKFWVRVFELEGQLAFIQAKINEKSNVNIAVVPIISEYEVDEHLRFVYALRLLVDPLGVRDGTGLVFMADKENLAIAYRERDRLADSMMDHFRARAAAESKFEIDYFVTEPGKQK